MNRVLVFFFAIAAIAAAQKFEVASVRPSGPNSPHGSDGGPGHQDSTRFTCGTCPLNLLIQMAWNVKSFQISSSSDTVKDFYDINVTVPAGATKEQFRVMLQNLLKERFDFRFRMDSREFPGYELVVAKTGFKLQDGAAGPTNKDLEIQFPPNTSRIATRNTRSGGYTVVHMIAQLEPMKQIAEFFSLNDEPIVDRTGLTGKYSFILDYSIDHGGVTDALPPAPSLFVAVQRELGLQLLSKKIPFDVVVVESFNRVPTEN